MKRLVNSSTDARNYDLIIEIEYLNLDPDVVMASDTHVHEIPNSAQGEWEAFLLNMCHIFHKNGFEIKESQGSNRNGSLSQYYAIYPADSNKIVCYEILIILRVSDHPLLRGIDNGEAYYEKYAQENKYPEDKDFQEWELQQISVNGYAESSYVKAIRDVKKLVQDWKEVVSDS